MFATRSAVVFKAWSPGSVLSKRVPCALAARLFGSEYPMVDKDFDMFRALSPKQISPKTDYMIAGRQFLPGSKGPGFPKLLRKPREGFPFAVQAYPDPSFSIEQWASQSRQFIDENLPRYGAILLRGLPLRESSDVSDFALSLGYEAMKYPGGGAADRSLHDAAASVYTASNEPPEFTIELHHELGYLPTYPRKLVFFCVQEPAEGCGGLTVISDNKEFTSRLDPQLIQKLKEKHIRYIHKLPDESVTNYVSWQQTLKTKDKKEAEEFLTRGGYEYCWHKSRDTLTFWNTLPAFIPHPETGESIWFNSVHISHISGLLESPMFPGYDKMHTVYVWNAQYGDGSDIEPEVIQHIRACYWQSTVGFQWKTSDVLVVDNMAVQHGRLSFQGDRKILAFLLAN
ncbi:dapdiamide synthesis protein DdaC isoform X2 [Nematostella vectensis]|uniref:dapdiamide synthesis protein DdaC isoform X2 n=1 Tax=Nematostella vectensis TaxID=45351 RepID=UPI00139061CD|nr:dapdiamide synthesis protein DdaC isoform X2 [Nematostella vectensis]